MAIENVVDKIKKVLLNYDFEIETAKAQLRKSYAKVSCFKDSKIHWQQEKYYSGQIEQLKYKTYIDQLKKGKQKLMDDLSQILDIYYPVYKHIWLKYCIEDKSPKDIAKELKTKKSLVNKAIKTINKDLINYKILNTGE